MAVLNNRNTTPPDGYIYTQPETGVKMEGETMTHIEDLVIHHRQWKGLIPVDRETVSLEIQRQICSGQSKGVCRGEPGENYDPYEDKARQLNSDKIMEFSKAAFDFIGSGAKMVSKPEAERRAAICRGCRFNRPSPSCVCTPIYKLIDSLVPSARKEPGLHVCGICGCTTAAKILLPISGNPDSQYRFPPYCWMNDGQKEKEQIPS